MIAILMEFMHFLLDVQGNCEPGSWKYCDSSVLHPITAALATQGYWIQADILWYIKHTGLEGWAILIYTLAIGGALISMALGSPPKLYLWLLISPGIYHWLIQDTVPMVGVHWNQGDGFIDNQFNGRTVDVPFLGSLGFNNQRTVWKLSEVGLANSALVLDSKNVLGGVASLGGGYKIYADKAPGGKGRATYEGDPEGTVRVSNLFRWYDALISDLVGFLIKWTGLYTMGAAQDIDVALNPLVSASSTNLPPTTIMNHDAFTVLTAAGRDNFRGDDSPWLLSKNKWSYLMDITGAVLHNGDLREAFTVFLSSECGDAFTKGLNKGSFVAAQSSKGLNIPQTVFLRKPAPYSRLTQNLISNAIPTPPSVKNLLMDDETGGFRNSIGNLTPLKLSQSGIFENIRCDDYLQIIVDGFRWEAAHAYYQFLTSLPPEVPPVGLIFNLFYGWDFNKEISEIGPADVSTIDWSLDYILGNFNKLGTAALVTPEEQEEFLTNLFFAHLLRNELATAPKPVDIRNGGQSQQALFFAQNYQSQVGSRTKFSEVYTWAMMMPYLMGILMYLLALGYPFVAFFMLIPGQYKIIWTWISFWTWVKIWDIGFAIVMVMERTIWAMMGNGPNTSRIFSRVISMGDFGDYSLKCPSGQGNGGISDLIPFVLCRPGIVPEVLVGASGKVAEQNDWYNTLRYLDSALTLGTNLNLDLSNSYYIYIMAALYLAVPMVTGQLVLGAKAGVANLATSAIAGVASEVGRASGQGFTGEVTQRSDSVGKALQDSVTNKSLRSGADQYARSALDAGNRAMDANFDNSYSSAANNGVKQQANIARRSYDQMAAAGAFIQAQANLNGALGMSIPSQIGGMVLSSPLAAGAAAAAGVGGLMGAGVLNGGGASGGGDTSSAGSASLSSGRVNQQQQPSAQFTAGLPNLGSMLAGVGKSSAEAANLYGAMMVAGLNYFQQVANGTEQSGFDAMQAGYIADGLNSSTEAAGQGEYQRRAQGAMQYDSGRARYEATRNFANSGVAGYLSSLGASTSSIMATPPPDASQNLHGAAMSGILDSPLYSGGRNNSELAKYADPSRQGGFFSGTSGVLSDFNRRYGYNAALAAATPPPDLGQVAGLGNSIIAGLSGNAQGSARDFLNNASQGLFNYNAGTQNGNPVIGGGRVGNGIVIAPPGQTQSNPGTFGAQTQQNLPLHQAPAAGTSSRNREQGWFPGAR
jgi:hypothetical protein